MINRILKKAIMKFCMKMKRDKYKMNKSYKSRIVLNKYNKFNKKKYNRNKYN